MKAIYADYICELIVGAIYLSIASVFSQTTQWTGYGDIDDIYYNVYSKIVVQNLENNGKFMVHVPLVHLFPVNVHSGP